MTPAAEELIEAVRLLVRAHDRGEPVTEQVKAVAEIWHRHPAQDPVLGPILKNLQGKLQ